MSDPLRIAVAGLGTVGGGVIKILSKHADLIKARAGRPIEIISVCAKDRTKDRGVDLSSYDWEDELLLMAENENIDVVLEMIGGEQGAAKDLVFACLKNGKSVVTANKALLAHHGKELAELAEKSGANLHYEAAVAGGIPIIKSLREGFAANDIKAVYGILNGTCNYILTTMETDGSKFEDVLSAAQKEGYAEAEPSFDVDGIDTAHKLCILSGLAFKVKPDFKSIEIQGISHIGPDDIFYAKELGYRIKLLGAAKPNGDAITQFVAPCLVPIDSPIAAVDDVFNAVFIEGDFVDKGLAVGRGAGEGPTASAVVADIIDIARGNNTPFLGVPYKDLSDANWAGTGSLKSRFYIHLNVLDKPGALADVSAIFRDHKISMESVLQRSHDPDNPVSIIITTHEALQESVDKATQKISSLSISLEKPRVLRIEQFK